MHVNVHHSKWGSPYFWTKEYQVSPSLKQVSFHLSQIKEEGKKTAFWWCPDVHFSKFINQSTNKLEWTIFSYLIANKTLFNSCPVFFHPFILFKGIPSYFRFFFSFFFLGQLQPPLTTKIQGYKCKGVIHHGVSLGNVSSTKMHMNL